jgi:transposase
VIRLNDGNRQISAHGAKRPNPGFKLSKKDGRRLWRYKRRWLVERLFAWLQWKRGLLVR